LIKVGVLESLRDATVLLIAENPISITVRRVELKDDGAGGRYKEESDLASFAGRLVPSKQQVQKHQNEAGEIQFAGWMLIAPWDADVKAGSDMEDTFIADNQKYRVERVIQRRYQGDVYAVHAVLEEVS
jgi:hypothetical protein